MPTGEKKGRPISIRLRRDFEELLKLEAGRSGVSKTRMLEALAEEALKMRRYPGWFSGGRSIGGGLRSSARGWTCGRSS